ncbi:MAG: hypothetical protein US42_C0004G0024 [Candidatus Magasanikbacteria bacterium GW2011_GWC2_37_14]|uniref:Glycosyltransferase subfamily 4-like N-terminal domain-containing protein n=1 Tax=Candidatus Magasanikbacteria bacterium GW2011_GWC2_37_14 TaxID=1619046 RepID=A0A0G0GNZ8_9BACT|nr:MAG: hypothetical protein US42_C0004G0024 [Candidatus Magasanikbacteria bacterium GW2011_GWC2_37_14]
MESQDKQKKKILYVITQGEWGGAQRYVYDLAINTPTDWQVFVAVGEKNRKKELQEKILADNKKQITFVPSSGRGANSITIVQLSHLVRKICPWHDILAIFELRRLYKTLKPDVVHLNSSKAGIVGSLARLGIASSPFGTSRNDKLVYTVHGWVFNEPMNNFRKTIYRFLEKITAKLKDKIIVLSDKDYQDGMDLGIAKNKLVKIPLGIEKTVFLERDVARRFLASVCHSECSGAEPRNPLHNTKRSPASAGRQAPLVASLGRDDSGNIWVGTIANLYKTKGIDILIEAVKLLSLRGSQFALTDEAIPMKQGIATPPSSEARNESGGIASSPFEAPRNDSAKFIIIGEGPEHEKLQQQINKLQINNIHLLGSIENASQYLTAFDIFVLPSRKEGLPYTILEALSANLPIVATNVGGIPELIEHEKTGLLSPASSELLAENLVKIISNQNLQEQFTQSPKPNYTLEKMLATTFECYLHP